MRGKALVLALLVALAADRAPSFGTPTQRVVFRKNCRTATVSGMLIGGERRDRDYILTAKMGQTIHVELMTDSAELYYSVYPGTSERAVVTTALSGDVKWSGAAIQDGDYRVRVCMRPGAARQRMAASYRMKFSLSQ